MWPWVIGFLGEVASQFFGIQVQIKLLHGRHQGTSEHEVGEGRHQGTSEHEVGEGLGHGSLGASSSISS